MEKKDIKSVEQFIKEFFLLLGVNAPFEISEEEEGLSIALETEGENGMLIGYHGETLEALQLIVSMAVAKKLGKFIRISLEIGEYKKNRMEYLTQLVSQVKERALQEGAAIPLPSLKAWERRFVHVLVKEDEKIFSESSGEGRDRVLTIYPKQ